MPWTRRQETQARVQDCLLTGGICCVIGPQFPHLLGEGRLHLRTLILRLTKSSSVASKKSAFLVSGIFPSLAEHFSKNKAGRLEFILAAFTTYVSLFLGVCSVPLFWFSYPGIPVMDVLIHSPSCLTPKYFIHHSVLCRRDLPPKMAISQA